MRGAALAALAAGALLAALASPAGAGEDLRTGACKLERHSERVVKKVKRHGEWVKVVRIRRWTTCEPLREEPAGPARISVKAFEFSFVLSRPELPAGESIFEFNNIGEDPHDLNIAQAGSAEPAMRIDEVPAQERATARFTLAAGQYQLWCALPDHRELGMEAELTVTASP